MINLKNAKIDDRFLDEANEVVKIVYISKNCHEFCGEYEVNGSLLSFDINGIESIDGILMLYKKHDDRWWLKDLPDADLFADFCWIACDNPNGWFLYAGEPNLATNSFSAIGMNSAVKLGEKMPKLTCEEWKQSKISIAELREWQGENKHLKNKCPTIRVVDRLA